MYFLASSISNRVGDMFLGKVSLLCHTLLVVTVEFCFCVFAGGKHSYVLRLCCSGSSISGNPGGPRPRYGDNQ